MDVRVPVSFIKKQLQEREKRKGGAGCERLRGIYRTRVQDITSELGDSTGAFYLYFPDKRELFVKVSPSQDHIEAKKRVTFRISAGVFPEMTSSLPVYHRNERGLG